MTKLKTYTGPSRIVHRGCVQKAPENTLEACAAALELGFEGAEIDIQLTKDKKVVLAHDADLDKLTAGHPTKHRIEKIADMTWRELAEMQIPYKGNLLPYDPETNHIGSISLPKELKNEARTAKFILFEDLLQWTLDKRPGFFFEVEYKASGLTQPLVDIFNAVGGADRCILFSGNDEGISEIQSYFKSHNKPEGLKLGANIWEMTPDWEKRIDELDLYEAGLNIEHISEDVIKYLKQRNIKIFSNLGDQPSWWKKMCDLKIDGFKTNYPEKYTDWWENEYPTK